MEILVYKYDDVFESWVFTTEERALDNINSMWAFEALTWGEFKALLPANDYEWISEILIERQFGDEIEDIENYVPSDDQPFTEGLWMLDAEYPPCLIFENQVHLPKQIIEQFGEVIITMHDGEYYKFHSEAIGDIIKYLRDAGISAEHRPDLEFR